MRPARLFAAVLALGSACWLHAFPAVVIVQALVAGPEDSNPNVPIGHYLAQELADGGKLAPIVWSMEDAIFRTAVEENLVKNVKGNPPLDDVLQAAGKLHAEYILVVSCWREAGVMKARAALLRRGSVVWFDPGPETSGSSGAAAKQWVETSLGALKPASKAFREVSVSLNDPENGVRSLARTWALMVATGPLKDLPTEPLLGTPEADPGQRPPGADPTPIAQIDNKELLASIETLVRERRLAVAVNTLRDAIDTEPLDAERRRKLVDVLLEMGRPLLAAREARTAARLLPDRPHLWAVAARASLEAGEVEQAQDDVNELVARAPENPDARILLGEVRLRLLDPVGAVEHLDAAIESSPSGEAHFLRALAHAFSGDGERSLEDLRQSTPQGAQAAERAAWRYDLATSLAGRMADVSCNELRDLIPIARVRPKDEAVAGAVEARWRQIQGTLGLLASIEVVESHRRSYERRDLALKLLAQTLSDFRAYLKSGDEGLLTDATINLGEARKHLAAAKELAQTEGAGG